MRDADFAGDLCGSTIGPLAVVGIGYFARLYWSWLSYDLRVGLVTVLVVVGALSLYSLFNMVQRCRRRLAERRRYALDTSRSPMPAGADD